ncbi:PEP-CTERM sorting domain-containing protein [Akkermansia muciniphila]|uniref:PEP-CTERM sorting domain-containing protein n=1 Tax=Akkermansia muciniphila TaxID=239935 RepID=UPI0015E0EAD3|nr:PEP-CTERM sorting domain-containing protein [Akkermansia sp.]
MAERLKKEGRRTLPAQGIVRLWPRNSRRIFVSLSLTEREKQSCASRTWRRFQVPEPGAAGLSLLGLAAALWRRRRE